MLLQMIFFSSHLRLLNAFHNTLWLFSASQNVPYSYRNFCAMMIFPLDPSERRRIACHDFFRSPYVAHSFIDSNVFSCEFGFSTRSSSFFSWHIIHKLRSAFCSLSGSGSGLLMLKDNKASLTNIKAILQHYSISTQSNRKSGAPNVNFRKISVRKTIWDMEFSKHSLQNFVLACLS